MGARLIGEWHFVFLSILLICRALQRSVMCLSDVFTSVLDAGTGSVQSLFALNGAILKSVF